MSKKSKKRRSRDNRLQVAPTQPAANDSLNSVMAPAITEEGAASVSEPGVAPRPAWTLPHIDSNEASGDPFIMDVPVSKVANDVGPAFDASQEDVTTSAQCTFDDAAAAPGNDDTPAFDDQKPNLKPAYLETLAAPAAAETMARASHASASGPEQVLPTNIEPLLNGTWRIGDQILANLEANERAALQAAGALLQARSLPEIVTVQLRYGVEQFAALGIQSVELVELISKIYSANFVAMQGLPRHGAEDATDPS